MAALGEMAGGLAHEINNPLVIISARLETALQDLKKVNDSDPKVIQTLEKIPSVVFRIARIVAGLRQFARDGSQDALVPTTSLKIIEDH